MPRSISKPARRDAGQRLETRGQSLFGGTQKADDAYAYGDDDETADDNPRLPALDGNRVLAFIRKAPSILSCLFGAERRTG